ncbi:MAG: VOC family protein [Actinomycetota bacterium]|nr:VOC family protein [Actinomycetota bacterium]
MITASTYGAPNWVDLTTPDIEAATTFYRRLFDWDVETSVTPMGDYHIGKVDGMQVAGMMQATPEMGDMPAWTVFINIENIDETIDRARAAGGTILQEPIDIPDGQVAVVADPAGAMFGLYSGIRPDEVWISRDAGRVSWVETLTRDPTASEGFYIAVFDWKAETQDYERTRYTTFMLDDEQVAGMMMMPDSVPSEAPSHWAVYFTVDDCDQAVERAIELGGKALGPVMEFDMGRFAVMSDPQGAVFQLMEYAE